VIGRLRTDTEATLLACSSLALPKAGSLRPLGPKGWARLRERAAGVGVEPRDMLSLDADELGRRLGLDEEWSARLAGLFARRGQLAMELERLSRLGIWVTTLGDERYPTLLADRLGDLAPPVLFGLGDHALLERPGLAVVGSRDAGPEVRCSRPRGIGYRQAFTCLPVLLVDVLHQPAACRDASPSAARIDRAR
jgi:DNA processing protein